MLWTLNGLLLLLGLGIIIGVCGVMFVKAQEWKCGITSFGVGVAAILGTLYLVMDWLGPAGGA